VARVETITAAPLLAGVPDPDAVPADVKVSVIRRSHGVSNRPSGRTNRFARGRGWRLGVGVAKLDVACVT